MLFSMLGRLVSSYWPVFLVAWAALSLGVWLSVPSWNALAKDEDLAFLPPDAPTLLARKVYNQAFPEQPLTSNIVLVFHREGTAQFSNDLRFLNEVVEPGLRGIAHASGGFADPLEKAKDQGAILRVRLPNPNGPGTLLASPDQRALLVVIDLVTEYRSRRNWPVIEQVEALARDLKDKLPAGLEVAVTGSAVIGRDHAAARLQSARNTEILTVVLVVVLLLVIYRAPLLALIPLLTVFLAVQISVSVLALLAQNEIMTLFQGLQIYITILAYGAGVDYSLFLTARYKEELDRGLPAKEALVQTVGSVGGALVASAATVMFGIGMMVFAEFGKFREAGYAIPLSLALVLAATLTFSPALLRLAGHWAFWPRPRGAAQAESGGPEEKPTQRGLFSAFWQRLADLLMRRPGTIWVATVAIMAPFAVAGVLLYNHLSFDLIGDLPADSASVSGTRLLEEHFSPGIMGTATLLVINKDFDCRRGPGNEVLRRITEQLRTHKDSLGLADIRGLIDPLGISPVGQRVHFLGPAAKRRLVELTRERYLTSMGEGTYVGTRFDLVFAQSPFTRGSIENLEKIEQAVRDALPDDKRASTQVHFLGMTATVRDLSDVMKRDRVHIEALVLVSVLGVLIVLLLRVGMPLYLLASVLFSYYVTLGATFGLFYWLDPEGFAGIDWKVAIFLFTILIAVGEDYNILLLARIREEERRHGPVRGITVALTRTGPIISSCGIIMAGTFASLLAGSLSEMKQLGFALSFGVLLDTFIVRPILVPSFMLLVHRFRGRSRNLQRVAEVPHSKNAAPRAAPGQRLAKEIPRERAS